MAEFQIDSDSNSVTSADLKVVLATILAYNDGIFVSKGVEIKKSNVEVVSYRARRETSNAGAF